MKVKRQKLICELIRKFDIETQEELAAMLCKNGFNVTQTTVSRDIKELKLVKVQSNNGSKYTLPDNMTLLSKRGIEVLETQLVSIANAGNMLVFKTQPGAGTLVAAAIDSLGKDELLGTVSGYDTVFAVSCSEKQAQSVKDELKRFIKSSK